MKNKQYKPSNYYRIVQYTNYLDQSKIKLHSLIPDFLYLFYMKHREHRILKGLSLMLAFMISSFRLLFSLLYDLFFTPDYIIIQKSISKIRLPFLLYQLLQAVLKRSYLIWDFDDNILYNKEISLLEFNLYCENAKKIIVPSEFLKELLPSSAQKKVVFLPTLDCALHVNTKSELEEILNFRQPLLEKKIILVWLASSSSIEHLIPIIPTLEQTAKLLYEQRKMSLILKVICDKKITTPTKHLTIQHVPWSRDILFDELKSSHIGIMPLKDSPTSRGKAGFKIIQYLGMGLPIIASNVGYNKDHFSKKVGFFVEDTIHFEEWKNAILSLSQSTSLWRSYSYHSYDFYLQHFNYKDNIKKLKSLLR